MKYLPSKPAEAAVAGLSRKMGKSTSKPGRSVSSSAVRLGDRIHAEGGRGSSLARLHFFPLVFCRGRSGLLSLLHTGRQPGRSPPPLTRSCHAAPQDRPPIRHRFALRQPVHPLEPQRLLRQTSKSQRQRDEDALAPTDYRLAGIMHTNEPEELERKISICREKAGISVRCLPHENATVREETRLTLPGRGETSS